MRQTVGEPVYEAGETPVPVAEPAPRPVLKAIPSDTTIPPGLLDPKAPVPTIPIGGTVVYQCDRPPAGVVITGKKKP